MDDPTDFSAFLQQQQMKAPPYNLRFFTEAVHHPGKSAEEGRAIYVDRDFVAIMVPGAKDEVVRRAEDKAKEDQYIAHAYERWKTTKEQPIEGTPLAMVAFLKPSQIKEMEHQGVRSLENLAGLSDAQAQRVGFDGMQLRDKAKAFLEQAREAAPAMRLAEENAKLKRDMGAMQQQIDALAARLEAKEKAA